jgi:PAS domain S-box-containing protein
MEIPMITESASQDFATPTTATNAAEVVCVLDAKGVIRFATPATAGFYGYALADLIGRSSLHFIAPEAREAATARWKALVEDPGRASDEMFVTMLCAPARPVGRRRRRPRRELDPAHP